jgi:hypothetical protein
MRLRSLAPLALVLVVSAVLAACDNSSATDPTNGAAQVSLLTIRSNFDNRSEDYSTDLFFGSGKVDSSLWNLGQRSINGIEAIVLESGEKVSVYSGITGASGLESDGVFVPSFRVLSDWNVIEPEKHRGVIFNGTSDFLLRVTGVATDSKRSFAGELPEKLYTISTAGKDPSAKLTLPAIRGYQFVFPYQRYTFSCAGDDSVTVHSSAGMIESHHHLYGDFVTKPYTIPDVTIVCKTYSSASAANLARAAALREVKRYQ